jgi:hypothetical protein
MRPVLRRFALRICLPIVYRNRVHRRSRCRRSPEGLVRRFAGEAYRDASASVVIALGLAALFTAAKFVFSCVPSQNGFVLELPQRQRAIVLLTSYSLPSASRRVAH